MRLLLAKEAADLLRVSENRLYDLAKRGMVPHVHLGRQLRFPEDRLLAWVEAGGSPLEAPSPLPLNSAGIPDRGVR